MKSFNELSIDASILKSITDMGYETPSPIQAQTLPILLGDKTDFIGLAATGTGKTAAFSIPLLNQIDSTQKHVQALVLCPTRELALQVCGQINLLGKHKGVKALPIYGGSSYSDQIYGLKAGAMVVVGTPGRIVDHIERGTLKLQNLQTIILDEADEMISMGFKEDLETVLNQTNRESSKIWLFSATMSREVRKVADTYLKSPQQVQVNRTEMLSTTVEQIYYPTQESNKPDVLCKLIEAADDFYGIIFCQTKALVVDVTQYLVNKGYKVDCLHGDKDQNARERTMQAFRDKKVTMLVCTDVASRGLDVKDVTHVINYSIPRELDSYVHRIGRTARSGKSGFAFSLVTASHRGLIPRIEQLTKSKMKEGRLPTRKEIGIKKISKILPSFQDQEFHTRAVEILDESWKTAISGMTTEEVVGRFLTLMCPDIFVDQKNPTYGLGNQRPPEREERAPRNFSARNSSPRPRFSEGRSENRPENRSENRSESRPARRDESDSRPAPRRDSDSRPARSFEDSRPAPRRDSDSRPARSFEDSRPAPRAESDRPARRFESDSQPNTRPAGRFVGATRTGARKENGGFERSENPRGTQAQRPNRFSTRGSGEENNAEFSPPWKKPRASEGLPWMKRAPRSQQAQE